MIASRTQRQQGNPTREVVRHPIFARGYARWAPAADARGQREHRAELLAGTAGRVVEVGAGIGLNFRHYPPTVVEVVAVEPETHLRQLAEEEATRVGVELNVVDGVASALPFEDAVFDIGVASLVLCSVSDPVRALGELRRVIRPGGELRFYEHVVSPSPAFARVQRAVDRVFWPRIGAGCHAGRDTLAAIREAGFEVERCRRITFKASPIIGIWTSPHVLGVARRT